MDQDYTTIEDAIRECKPFQAGERIFKAQHRVAKRAHAGHTGLGHRPSDIVCQALCGASSRLGMYYADNPGKLKQKTMLLLLAGIWRSGAWLLIKKKRQAFLAEAFSASAN